MYPKLTKLILMILQLLDGDKLWKTTKFHLLNLWKTSINYPSHNHSSTMSNGMPRISLYIKISLPKLMQFLNSQVTHSKKCSFWTSCMNTQLLKLVQLFSWEMMQVKSCTEEILISKCGIFFQTWLQTSSIIKDKRKFSALIPL